MIHAVRVTGYKSLVDLELELEPLTVILGPNAAGKSNLLDALNLLSSMVTEETPDLAFEHHRGAPLEAFTFDERGLEGLQARETASFVVEVDVCLSQDVVSAVEQEIRHSRAGLSDGKKASPPSHVREHYLRYRLEVEIRTATGHLRVRDERLEALKQDGTPKLSRKPFLERREEENFIRLRMERQGHPKHEPVGQDRTIVSKPLYPPHYPHVTAFQEELRRWRFYFLNPSVMREEVPIQHVTALAPDGADVAAFYNTLKANNELQFRSTAKALGEVVPGVDDLDVHRTEEGLVRLAVREHGMPLSSRLISEGTLRVLGLLAITNPMEPLSVVGYEEPENGVHATRLSLVSRLLINAAERGDSQFLVNTHSPVLPEMVQVDPHARLIRCWKEGRVSRFEELREAGTLRGEEAIEEALEEPATPLRDRIVRGDLG